MAEESMAPGLVEASAPQNLPRCIALLVCDYANMSDEGKHNVMGVFNQVIVRPPDLMSPRFYVYFSVEGFRTDPLRLCLLTPTGDEVVGGTLTPAPNDALPLIGTVSAHVPFRFEAKGPGLYRLELSCHGQVMASTPIMVEYINEDGDNGE